MKAWLLAMMIALTLAAMPMPAPAQAAIDATPLKFDNTAQEQRFHTLVSQLRCVMCQNQSLADSNAQIAFDLRREVLELMRQGLGDEQIEEYLVARYGEFVLYKPRVEAATWLLWFGPAVLLLAGGWLITGIVRKRRGRAEVPPDDSQEW